MMLNDIAILIPAYNESKNIQNVLLKVKEYFNNIVVVDDGSIDNTVEICISNGAHVIRNIDNMGYNFSILKGVEYCVKNNKYKYCITIDADGQHLVEDVIKVSEILIASSSALVVGKRPKFQRFSEYMYSFYSSKIWGISDPLCGLKGYNLNFYRSNKIKLDINYDSIGTELMIKFIKNNCKFVNLEISIEERIGNSRFGSGINANLKILKGLFNAWRMEWK
jgi:glycosyltransferase involved in cell wall biosynthesis